MSLWWTNQTQLLHSVSNITLLEFSKATTSLPWQHSVRERDKTGLTGSDVVVAAPPPEGKGCLPLK